MSKEKAPCKRLSITMLDSAIKAKKKYYLQILLEECKYEPNKIKMSLLDDLVKSSSDKSDSEADNVSNDETESDDGKEIIMNLTNNLLKAKKLY